MGLSREEAEIIIGRIEEDVFTTSGADTGPTAPDIKPPGSLHTPDIDYKPPHIIPE
jgi:hypothetical protein